MTDTPEHWKSRVIELEEILEQCAHALALVPIQALKGNSYVWIPSEVALRQLAKAKDAVREYISFHWSNDAGNSRV